MKRTLSELEQIKDIARDIARAVSGIFTDVEVVVVGKDEMIFAKSNKYLSAKDSPGYSPYINGILARDTPVIIDDPGENELCSGCEKAKNCNQKLEIAVPFHIGDYWSGYISMVAFSDEAKTRYLERKDQVLDFLTTLINVMVKSGKMQLAEASARRSEQKVSVLLNTMDTGVFTCDMEGKILSSNQTFRTMFGLDRSEADGAFLSTLLGTENPLQEAIRSGLTFNNRECALMIRGELHRLTVNFRFLSREDDPANHEYLFTLRTQETVRELLSATTEASTDTIDEIIGGSPETIEMKENIRQFAQSASTVLIRGETGTGKELVARSLHSLSPRREEPFVTINCAAIPDSILESELFGYEPGTFTGANKGGKPGLFELGNGGTIFLDEIGDMPLHLQAKLLRVLQERKVVRLGGFHPMDLDIRVIAATNQDLEEMVRQMKFRSDLFYRLNILPVYVPPLRRRMGDFDDLVFHFIEQFGQKLNKPVSWINNHFLDQLKHYSWPGNIRELENAIEYAINMSKEPVLTIADCPPDILAALDMSPAASLTLKEMVQREEARILKEFLRDYGKEKAGVAQAAKVLGISRASLYNKIRDYDLSS